MHRLYTYVYISFRTESLLREGQGGELKPGFDIVVTVVKIESRSFSSAEIQHHRTEITRSDYN
jgi:hypothetical protein